MAQRSNLPSSAEFERLEGELFARIGLSHRRQVLRHRLVAAAIVLTFAGAGVAAGTIANPSQQANLAYCYGGTTPGSPVTQGVLPSNGVFQPRSGSKTSPARVARALALCEGSWKSGIFSKGNGNPPFPVPRLQVCLRDDLIVSVFPKKNAQQSANAFCNNLGLSAP
jgi:hypothetical protein